MPAVTVLNGCCYCQTVADVVTTLLSSRRFQRSLCSAVTVVVRPLMLFVCSFCALWLLLDLVVAVNLLKRCRTAVAVVLSSLLLRNRRCRSCALPVLFGSCWLWLLQSIYSRAVAVAVVVSSLSSCRNCCCAVAVVRPSLLSFCRRCCRTAVDVVRVLLLCYLALAAFDHCSQSPQGLLLLLSSCRPCRRANTLLVPSLSYCRRCRTAVAVVARPSMSFVCSFCALSLLLALVAAVNLHKGYCYCRTVAVVVPSLSSCQHCRRGVAVVLPSLWSRDRRCRSCALGVLFHSCWLWWMQ